MPGVTDTEVVLGITTPLSGPAAAWGTTGSRPRPGPSTSTSRGASTDGSSRSCMKDDGYAPGRAVANVTEMKD